MIPIAVLVFVMGIFPGPFLRKMDASVNQFINHYKSKYEVYAAERNGHPVLAALEKGDIGVGGEAISHAGRLLIK
jgi:hypothetical protein